MKRRALFFSVLLLLLFFFSETACWIMLRFLEHRPIGAAVFIVRRSQTESLGSLVEKQTKEPLFDRELGWRRRTASASKLPDGTTYTFLEDGSRLSGTQEGPAIASFYGCSGTMGLEVSDPESFPAQFSRLAGVRVKNWGTLAYGPDQSLLLFEKKLEESPQQPPVAFLCFAMEGINRSMSAWRLFYTGENLLKPRLMETPDGLRPFNPILENPKAWFQASDHDIVQALAPYDDWLTSRIGGMTIAKPAVEFPYTLSLTKAVLYLLGKHQSELAFPEKKNQSPFNLYDQKQSLVLLEKIVDRFFERCRERGIKGYLVLVTYEFYLDATTGKLESRTLGLTRGHGRRLDENFIQYLDQKGLPYIDTTPICLKVLQEEGSLKSMFCPYEHPSARANKMFAEAIVERLHRDGVGLRASAAPSAGHSSNRPSSSKSPPSKN